jgi:hypothetical protein
MAKAVGMEMRAAMRKAVQWGTAVACGAGDGLLVRPPSVRKRTDMHLEDSLGVAFPLVQDRGAVAVQGDIPAYLRYDSLDLPVALAMGETGGAPTQPDGANDPNTYRQTFTLAEHLEGLFATFALYVGVNVEECPSLKVSGFTLKGQVGTPVMITFHTLADDLLTRGTVNTTGGFSGVTCRETGHRVLMSHGTFRLNDQSGAALEAADVVHPASFELTFKRKLTGVYAAGQADRIDEPSTAGVPEVTLKLVFPRYTADTYFADMEAGTLKKMDIVFKGALIDAAYRRTFALSFPALALREVDLPKAEGILRHPLTFACLAADEAPAGMAGVTKPFRVEVTNRNDTDVLMP